MAPRTVRTVATLRHKRDEIAKAVAEYERRLAKARDLFRDRWERRQELTRREAELGQSPL